MCRAGDVDIQIWRVLGVLIHICAGLGMLISRSGGLGDQEGWRCMLICRVGGC